MPLRVVADAADVTGVGNVVVAILNLFNLVNGIFTVNGSLKLRDGSLNLLSLVFKSGNPVLKGIDLIATSRKQGKSQNHSN